MEDANRYLSSSSQRLMEALAQDSINPLEAIGWMQGATETLEAIGAIERASSRSFYAEFNAQVERASMESGRLQVMHLESNISAKAEASGAAQADRHHEPPPVFLGVTAVGAEVPGPGNAPLTLIAVVGWSDGLELEWAWFTDERAQLEALRHGQPRPRPRRSILPWDIDVWDDTGTRYRPTGGGGSGKRKTTRLTPALPAGVAHLTLALRDPETAEEVARVDVPTPWRHASA